MSLTELVRKINYDFWLRHLEILLLSGVRKPYLKPSNSFTEIWSCRPKSTSFTTLHESLFVGSKILSLRLRRIYFFDVILVLLVKLSEILVRRRASSDRRYSFVWNTTVLLICIEHCAFSNSCSCYLSHSLI